MHDLVAPVHGAACNSGCQHGISHLALYPLDILHVVIIFFQPRNILP